MDTTNEDGEAELFGTETMAELYARQGRLGAAVRIYQRLIEQRPEDERHAQWVQRCQALERAQARVAEIPLAELEAAAKPPRPKSGAEKRPRGGRRDPGTLVGATIEGADTDAVPLSVTADDTPDITQVDAPIPGTPPRPADDPGGPREVAGEADSGAVDADGTRTPRPEITSAPTEGRDRARGDDDVRVITTVEELPTRVHELPMVITQPVRSGQVVYARNNDLIVLAPVNAGGQVVADGNIHVYAALRGRAMAGAQGAPEARIFCLRLEPELLAINGVYLVWDDIPKASLGQPAQISLQDGVCVVAPLGAAPIVKR